MKCIKKKIQKLLGHSLKCYGNSGVFFVAGDFFGGHCIFTVLYRCIAVPMRTALLTPDRITTTVDILQTARRLNARFSCDVLDMIKY